MIEGIVIKSIVSHSDERQAFREIIRVTDSFFGEGFGQFSHAIMLPSTAKGWHIHKTQAITNNTTQLKCDILHTKKKKGRKASSVFVSC